MKKFFGILAGVCLAVNILFACGGMSPAPAPADIPSVDVPDLPSNPGIDNPSNPGIDNPSNPGVDNPSNPGDPSDGAIEDTVGGPGVDNPSNPGVDNNGGNGDLDLGNLPSDLPNDKTSGSDKDFVATVL